MTYAVDNRPQQSREGNSQLPASMGFLGIAMLISAVAAFLIGPMIPPSAVLPISVAVVVLLLASVVLRKIPGFSYILLVIVPAAIGVMLYPILESYVAAGLGGVIVSAAVATTVVFTTIAVIAWFTKKNLYRWAGLLFGITLGIIAISFLNALLLQLPILSLVISCAVVVVFSFWSFIDIQSIRDLRVKPVDGALNVFIDIVNLFLSILNIFSWLRP